MFCWYNSISISVSISISISSSSSSSNSSSLIIEFCYCSGSRPTISIIIFIRKNMYIGISISISACICLCIEMVICRSNWGGDLKSISRITNINSTTNIKSVLSLLLLSVSAVAEAVATAGFCVVFYDKYIINTVFFTNLFWQWLISFTNTKFSISWFCFYLCFII